MRELYAYVWRASAPRQIVLIGLVIIAAVLATAPLELQRHIINTLAGHEKVDRLGWLCGGYLIAALSIGGLKYLVNIKSAGLGEAMIRSLREEALRSASPSIDPDATPSETGKDKSGALVTTIASQAEAVGKFVGDCISTPIVQAGTLLSVLSYMLYTEPRLGVVVLFISIPQLFLVPIIQRRLNVHVRERAHTLVRAGELMVGPTPGQGSAGSLTSEISKAFETIYLARLHIFQLKFGLKFGNCSRGWLRDGWRPRCRVFGRPAYNILHWAAQFANPVSNYEICNQRFAIDSRLCPAVCRRAHGLNGTTEIGIVVAFISGLDRVLEPWREMIAFVRSTSAARVQFDLLEDTLDRKL